MSFDSLLELEERFLEEGTQKGEEHGKQVGIEDGFKLGIKKGSDIGAEIGLYLGNCLIWKEILLLQMDQQPANSQALQRKLKEIAKLSNLISQYVESAHPKNEKIIELLESIRAKFKLVSAQMGIAYEASSSINF